MSIEENRAIVRRLDEVWNNGDLDIVDEIIAPDFGSDGRDGYKKWVTDVRAVFPDLDQTIERIIAEGDLVAARYVVTGTPEKEFLGLPPTGEQVKWTVTEFFRIADGMVVEEQLNWSALGVYQQLGGILTKGESEE